MSINQYYATQRFEDSGTPVTLDRNENHTVFDNKIVLDTIPDEFARVKITTIDGVATNEMVEIPYYKPITSANQFKVDYISSGFVYFHQSREGKTIGVSYKGKGYVCVSPNRIATQVSQDGTITETLNKLVDGTQTAKSETITATNNANIATTNANNATNTFNNETIMIYKTSVTNFANIATTYPTPQNGWTVVVTSQNARYRYNSTLAQWIDIDTAPYDSIGDLSKITSTNLVDEIKSNTNKIGNLLGLNTKNKTDLVGAINENVAQLNDIVNSDWDKFINDMINGSSVKIVCFGDSTTYGTGLTAGQKAYPQVLQEKLRYIYNNNNITVINAGNPGMTIGSLSGVFDSQVLAQSPNIMILMAGINDGIYDVTSDEYKSLLSGMIKKCKINNIHVILMSSIPDFRKENGSGVPADANFKVQTYAKANKKLSEQYNIGFIDMYTEWSELYKNNAVDLRILSDGIHPTEIGYSYIADIVIAKKLTPMYQSSLKEGQYLSFGTPFVKNTVSYRQTAVGQSVLQYNYVLQTSSPNEYIKFLIYNDNPSAVFNLLFYADVNSGLGYIRNFGTVLSTVNANNPSVMYDKKATINLPIGLSCLEIKASDLTAMFACAGIYRLKDNEINRVKKTALTLQNGWTNLGGGFEDLSIIQDGKKISVTGAVNSGTLTQGTVIASIPTDLKPVYNTIPIVTITGDKTGYVYVHAGNIEVYNMVAGWACFNFSWYID